MLGNLFSRLAPARGLRTAGCSLVCSIVLGSPERSLAQTVGADIMIRDGDLGGFAQHFAVAFEPGATYVAWRDTRSNSTTGGDIYAQKITPDGELLWDVNGVAVCNAQGNQQLPAITPDGAGGAVVVWLDDRGDILDSILGQRIGASGTLQWPVEGLLAGVVFSAQPRPYVHHAPNGGFVVTW